MLVGPFVLLLFLLSHREVQAQLKFVRPLAGTGSAGFSGDNGSPSSAALSNPGGLWLDSHGDFLLADSLNHRLRKITSSTNTISTIAGSGSSGFAGDGGTATVAILNNPQGVWSSTLGDVFIADTDNCRIRSVSTTTGIITTFAGTGTCGSCTNNVAASSSMLNKPQAISGDSGGVIYISDTANHVILKVQNGILTVSAGKIGSGSFTGDGGIATSATLRSPIGLWLTTDGALLVADSNNHRIRKISSTGIITTVMGDGVNLPRGDGGPATSASLYSPRSMCVATDNTMYVAETLSHRIRAVSGVSGIVSTFGGRGTTGPATGVFLNNPTGIALDSVGNLYFSDYNNGKVRKLFLSSNIVLDLVVGINSYGLFFDTTGDLYMNDFTRNGYQVYSFSKSTITPFQGFSSPFSIYVDTAGAVYIGEAYRIRRREVNGTLTVVAGTGTTSSTIAPDGSLAASSNIGNIYHLFADSFGTLYFADFGANKIRTVNSFDNTLGTFAGDGFKGYFLQHENVPASSASLSNPPGFWFDSFGNCFIADYGNNRIRKVTAGSRLISTFAGNGLAGFAGDGGDPLQSSIFNPFHIIGNSGNLFFTDNGNLRVRKIDLINNIISTLVGYGVRGDGGIATENTFATTGFLSTPYSVVVDQEGSVHYSDRGNQKIRTIFNVAYPTGQPTRQPTAQPSSQPTSQPSQPSSQPTGQPTTQPTTQPSSQPSRQPSTQPTTKPSSQPTKQPTRQPTTQPSSQPTSQPTRQPTAQPWATPTSQPTSQPTAQPTRQPMSQPTGQPSSQPSHTPSTQPTKQPTAQPTTQPITQPSTQPSSTPSVTPTTQPSMSPTAQPSSQPSHAPNTKPTARPTTHPITRPTSKPTAQPSSKPSTQPTTQPTVQPSSQPSSPPSRKPSTQPTAQPSSQPTSQPTRQPTAQPWSAPTSQPTTQPSAQPTDRPSTSKPTSQPTIQPNSQPTSQPSDAPTNQPTIQPTTHPSSQPSHKPSTQPTRQPTANPSSRPSAAPTTQPSTQPTARPSSQPSCTPSTQPTTQPSTHPTTQPTTQSTAQPTTQPTTQPTVYPSSQPSSTPTIQPTAHPTGQPSSQPSQSPSYQPTTQPTTQPSSQPSHTPSTQPTSQPSTPPTTPPTTHPSSQPSRTPSTQPTAQPTTQPSHAPSAQPTTQPSSQPSHAPSTQPTAEPTSEPTAQPSSKPSNTPSALPTALPTAQPSSQPTNTPNADPTSQPSSQPSCTPSSQPTSQPTADPTAQPTSLPTQAPSSQPTMKPTAQPSSQPSQTPSSQPTAQPSHWPSTQPTAQPTNQPVGQPSTQPSSQPSFAPSTQPTAQPSCAPTARPTAQPSSQPSRSPTSQPTSYPTTSYPIIVNVTSVTTRTSVLFDIHLSYDGNVYVAVFSCSSSLPISIDVILSNSVVVQSTDRIAHVSIDGLLPSAHYTAYVVTQSPIHGQLSPWEVVNGTRTAVVTHCCRDISLTTSSLMITEGRDVQDWLTVSLLPSPTKAFTLSLVLKALSPSPLMNDSDVSLSLALVPSALLIPTSFSTQPLTFRVSLSQSAVSLPVGKYALHTLYPQEMENVYGHNHTTQTSLEIVARNASLPAPVFLSAAFSSQGALKILFDSSTNQGDSPTHFNCSALFVFACAQTSRCQWIDDSRAVAVTVVAPSSQDNVHCAAPGDSLHLSSTANIRARCTSSRIVCAQWPTMNTWLSHIKFSPPSDPVKPTVSLSVPRSVSVCDSLWLDASMSAGHTGRRWTNASLSVIVRDADKEINITATQTLSALLHKHFTGVSPPLRLNSSLLRERENNTFTFTLTLCNFLDACGSQTREVLVLPASSAALSVSIAGPVQTRTIRVAQSLSLFAESSLSQCNTNNNTNGYSAVSSSMISYAWKVYRKTSQLERELLPLFAVRESSQFSLSAYSLQRATLYAIEVIARSYTPSGALISASSAVDVSVRAGQLRLVLRGGVTAERQVRAGERLSLNASQSNDEDTPTVFGAAAGLRFAWSCSQLLPRLNTSCGAVLENALDLQSSFNDSVHLQTRREASGAKLRVSLLISDASASRTSSATVEAVVLPADSLSIALSHNANANAQRINPEQQLQISGKLVVPVSAFTAANANMLTGNATWSLREESESESESTQQNANLALVARTALSRSFSVALPRNSSSSSLPQSISVNLVFSNNALIGGRTYTFVLSAFVASAVSSFVPNSVSASISVAVNSAPQAGEFTVTPSEGVGLQEQFFFSCEHWEDVEQDLPLSFSFAYVSTSETSLTLRARQESASTSSVLFPGVSSHNYSVTCIARVFDALSASVAVQRNVIVTDTETESGMSTETVTRSLSLSLSTLRNSSDLQAMQRGALVGAYMLNRANCSLSPDCAQLNRRSCFSTPHTCGPCVSSSSTEEQFVGDEGDSNSRCVRISAAQTNGTTTEEPKRCPSDCTGHGTCVYRSHRSGDLLSQCSASSLQCYAECVCFTGFGGKTCSLTAEEMQAKQTAREQVVDVLLSMYSLQSEGESTERESISSVLAAMNEAVLQTEEVSLSAAEKVLQFAKGASQTQSAVSQSTLQFLAVTVNSVAAVFAFNDDASIQQRRRRRRALSNGTDTHTSSVTRSHGEAVLDVMQSLARTCAADMLAGQQSVQIAQPHLRMHVGVYFRPTSTADTEDARDRCENASLSLPRTARDTALGETVSVALVPVCAGSENVTQTQTASEDEEGSEIETETAARMSWLSLSSRLFPEEDMLMSDAVGLQLSSLPCGKGNAEENECRITLQLRRRQALSLALAFVEENISNNNNNTNNSTETVRLFCGNDFVGLRQGVCAHTGMDVSVYCNGTRTEWLARCPEVHAEPSCAMLADRDNLNNCELLGFDDDFLTCSCALPTPAAPHRLLSNSNSETTSPSTYTDSQGEISVNYVSMLRTVTRTFSATVLSASSLSEDSVRDGWQAMAVVGSLAAAIAAMLSAGYYLDDHSKVEGEKTTQSSSLSPQGKEKNQRRSWIERARNKRNASHSHSHPQYGSAVGLLQIAEEALPQIFSSSSPSLMQKFKKELKRHHRWLGVFLHFSPSFPRVLRVMALTTNILTMLFVQSLTYNLTKGDDGSCEALHSESECLAPRSGFATGTSQCFWTPSETNTESGECAFVEPDSDLTVMVFVAVFSAIVSTPISLAADWVIHHILAAPTLAGATIETGKGSSSRAQVRVLPQFQSNANECGSLSPFRARNVVSIVPAVDGINNDSNSNNNNVDNYKKKRARAIFQLSKSDEAVWAKHAERELQLLQEGVAAYRQTLSQAECKEWDEVWGLDNEGHFLKQTNNHEPSETTESNACAKLFYKLRSYTEALISERDKSVVASLLSELHNLQSSLAIEKTHFLTDYLSEKEKNKRLLFLFQQDLLPGISGQIIEAKDRRDEPTLQAVSRTTKVASWLALGALNVGMLFYIFLFAVSQTVSRQRAWANSFAMWLFVEVCVVSSAMVFFMHVLLPLLAMRDVRKIKQRLLDSLRDYQLSVERNKKNNKSINKYREISAGDNVRSDEGESKNIEQSLSPTSSPFNAAQFLFLSHKMAQLYPELKVAQIVSQFHTPWPKQSYKRTTDLSQSYTGRFAAINKSLMTVLMFFVTSFLSVPASVQDMAMQVSATAVAGYTFLLHAQLYHIYPVLVVVPALILAAIVHVLLKSSRQSQQTILSRDAQAAGDNTEEPKGNGAVVTTGAEERNNTNTSELAHPHQVRQQRAHITRRASVAQGVAAANIAEQALLSEESFASSEFLDDESLFLISEESEGFASEEGTDTNYPSEDETGDDERWLHEASSVSSREY